MKKIASLIIILVLAAFLLAGCGTKDTVDQATGPREGETEDQSTEPGKSKVVDQFAEPDKNETVAEIVIRDYGSIYVKFFKDAAPKAVENFITHAKEGYYNGLTFHRIIEDFMIQGGDPTGTGSGGESIWGKEFEDEFSEELQPYRGSLCMANSGPDTNGSQFFIVQASETYTKEILNQIEQTYGMKFNEEAIVNYGKVGGTPWLYEAHTVFGQVYDGYEVLDAVAKVKKGDEEQGIPAEPVVIEKIVITEK